MEQTFKDSHDQVFSDLDILPGTSLALLTELVPNGSIHRLKMNEGTVIPAHTHPADEFVYVISGTLNTGGRICEKGTFWKTPAEVRQGPHEALTDVEVLTIRLGPMGEFEEGS